MATLVSPASEAGRLTAAFQTAQSRRAAAMAALVKHLPASAAFGAAIAFEPTQY